MTEKTPQILVHPTLLKLQEQHKRKSRLVAQINRLQGELQILNSDISDSLDDFKDEKGYKIDSSVNIYTGAEVQK